jgi:transglutaminase-like putative cysteine protease
MHTDRFFRFLTASALVLGLGSFVPAGAQPSSQSESPAMSPLPAYLVGRDVPEPIRRLEAQGKIAEAEKQIEARLAESDLDPKTRQALEIERERLRRLRRDFPLTPAAMLEKIQDPIPDATAEDLDRWRKEGLIQWAELDGDIRYFRREPVNLFRFSEEARNRRAAARATPTDETTTPTATVPTPTPADDPSAKPGRGFTINGHVADVLAARDKSDDPTVVPVRVRATHTIHVNPGVVPEGKLIRCWMPFPQDYRQQGDIQFLGSTPREHLIAPNGSPHRTIYLTRTAPAADQPAMFQVQYEYTCAAYVPLVDPEKVEPIPAGHPLVSPYLKEQPPHLLLTPDVRKLADEIVGDETNPYRKAEKIYRWMDGEIRYASEMEYAVMPSVTEKVMATKRGDCGVQVLMFVALCRASGVPARWQSGWATRPGSWNLHDWAEFYIPPYGWLPADPSFGLRKSDDERVHDFYIDHLDSYRMIANLGFSETFIPKKQFWRSDPVDNQRGEVEWDGGNLYYDDWDYDVEVEYIKE